jgi:hypothetical protein
LAHWEPLYPSRLDCYEQTRWGDVTIFTLVQKY